jgi:phage baseplate assembly protein W
MSHVELPHFQLPFRFEPINGVPEAAVYEQDTVDEITGCVEGIIRCPVGFRDELPDFGTPGDVLFSEAPLDLEAAKGAVSRWEPRAGVDYEESGSLFDEAIRNIGIRITPHLE